MGEQQLIEEPTEAVKTSADPTGAVQTCCLCGGPDPDASNGVTVFHDDCAYYDSGEGAR